MVIIVALVALFVLTVVALGVLAYSLIKDYMRDKMILLLIEQALPINDEDMKQKVMMLLAEEKGKKGKGKRASFADIKKNIQEAAQSDDDKKRRF